MQSKKDAKSIIDLLKFASLKEKEGTSVRLNGISCKTLYEYIEQLEKDNYKLDRENQLLFEGNIELNAEKQNLVDKLEKTINVKDVLVETTKIQKILYKGTIDEIKKVIVKTINEYRKEILRSLKGESKCW